MKRRPYNAGTPSGGEKPAAGDARRILSTPMGRRVTRRPKRGGQLHVPSVELLLYGVFRLMMNMDKLLEELLHTSLLSEGD